MSRWKSPKIAAKRAERAAKEAEENRKEKRNARLMIIGWAVVTIGLIVGDCYWLKARAQRRKTEHQRIYHQKTNASPPSARSGETNAAGSLPVKLPEKD